MDGHLEGELRVPFSLSSFGGPWLDSRAAREGKTGRFVRTFFLSLPSLVYLPVYPAAEYGVM